MSSTIPNIERRKGFRVKVNRLASISISHGHAIGGGIVRDRSAGGARITMAGEFGVSDEFVPLVPEEHDALRRC